MLLHYVIIQKIIFCDNMKKKNLFLHVNTVSDNLKAVLS